jgi:hypothetical protein
MRNLILFLTIILFATTVIAQDYSNLTSISLKDSIECKKAESKVLECSNYLLIKPCIEDLNSLNVIKFLLGWMGQTPDYSFSFEDKLYKSIKSNLMLSGRYLACQAKVAIIDMPKTYDKDFQYKYVNMFLEYCENPKNEVKISSKIKKLIDAKNNGSLKEILDE